MPLESLMVMLDNWPWPKLKKEGEGDDDTEEDSTLGGALLWDTIEEEF